MAKPISQKIADTIRAARQASGASQKVLAVDFGVSQSSVKIILRESNANRRDKDGKKPLSGSGDIVFRRVAEYYCDGCRAFVTQTPCPACLANAAKSRRKHPFGEQVAQVKVLTSEEARE